MENNNFDSAVMAVMNRMESSLDSFKTEIKSDVKEIKARMDTFKEHQIKQGATLENISVHQLDYSKKVEHNSDRIENMEKLIAGYEGSFKTLWAIVSLLGVGGLALVIRALMK